MEFQMCAGLCGENGVMCFLQATVVTGFETMAREECLEVLGVSPLISCGRIFFEIPIKFVLMTLEMRSIDNVYVFVYNATDLAFSSNKEESLGCIGETLASTDFNFKKALKIWRQITNLPIADHPDNELKFRVTCHRNGDSNAHSFSSPEAAVYFGGLLQDRFGWKADMTQFDIEVILNVLADQVYVTMALTRCSLHKRNISVFGSMTLRATVAYNMLRLARIRDDDLVCDPMCGTGAIPIEGALCWPKARYLCGDNHETAAPRTQQNIDKINEKLITSGKLPIILSILCWDITCLPLKTGSVDVIITDLPFGKRSGSKADNRVLYPKALNEMARVCRTNTGRAVLLTQDRRTMIQTLKGLSNLWSVVRTLITNIGGLTAGVYVLHRTTRNMT